MRASPFLTYEIQSRIFERSLDRSQFVIVAMNASIVRKAQSYAERLRVDLAILHGHRSIESETDEVDGRSSPPPIQSIEMVPGGESLRFFNTDQQRAPMTIVGDVKGRIALMVEDIVDDVEKFIWTATFLKEQGAVEVHLIATHALFSAEAAQQLEQSTLDEIILTNTGKAS